jgi:integration host factor subunit beta
MTKIELSHAVADAMPHLSLAEVTKAVKILFQTMTETLQKHQRIEIRGVGSFSVRYRAARQVRNPKTGEKIMKAGFYVPHFKMGKAFQQRLNILY